MRTHSHTHTHMAQFHITYPLKRCFLWDTFHYFPCPRFFWLPAFFFLPEGFLSFFLSVFLSLSPYLYQRQPNPQLSAWGVNAMQKQLPHQRIKTKSLWSQAKRHTAAAAEWLAGEEPHCCAGENRSNTSGRHEIIRFDSLSWHRPNPGSGLTKPCPLTPTKSEAKFDNNMKLE